MFHDREYEVRFWFGKDKAVVPWTKGVWKKLRPSVDRLITLGREPLSVRSAQVDPATFSQVKFGKLAWSDASDAKWLHASRDKRHFENLEIWAPSPAACGREDRAPDIYFDLSNLDLDDYRWFIIAAAAADLEGDGSAVMGEIHDAVMRQYPAAEGAWGTRQWGYGNDDSFSDGMQEISFALAHFLEFDGNMRLKKLRGKLQAL